MVFSIRDYMNKQKPSGGLPFEQIRAKNYPRDLGTRLTKMTDFIGSLSASGAISKLLWRVLEMYCEN